MYVPALSLTPVLTLCAVAPPRGQYASTTLHQQLAGEALGDLANLHLAVRVLVEDGCDGLEHCGCLILRHGDETGARAGEDLLKLLLVDDAVLVFVVRGKLDREFGRRRIAGHLPDVSQGVSKGA